MERRDVYKYGWFIVLVLLFYISYLVIKPFINALIASFILAYIFHPWYKRLKEKIKSDFWSAFLITALAIVIIGLPVVFLANTVVQEASAAYESGALDKASLFVTNLVGSNPEWKDTIYSFLSKAITAMTTFATEFLVSIPSKIFHAVIAVYAFFYMLLAGERTVQKVKDNLPLKDKERMVDNLGETTYAIVYGIFIIAVVEFILASLGFRIIGVGSPVLWGLVIGVLGLIPFLGPALVWIPLAIIKFVEGSLGMAVGIVIVGVMLTLIDTFGRAWIIGKKSKMHPVMIVLGIVGGVGVFGFMGVVAGPVLLSFVTGLVEEYMGEK
ncbi:MAG: AI-2E family transporter [Candidatus Nanoarchaeia archaeon]